MTALVSLAMIPIDCKIKEFSLHLFVYFFLVIIIILVKSQAPLQKKRMTTNIIFAGATPIN